MTDSQVTTENGARPAVDEMIRRIVDRFRPERIVVFGSHARGTAGPESDVDLLVVMPVKRARREKAIEINLALHDIRGPMNILMLWRSMHSGVPKGK